MPLRRINFTGRKRLNARDVDIRVHDNTDKPAFGITKLCLRAYDLPANARVYVEAYRQMSFMRFPCGTVAQPELSACLELTEFDSPEAIRFRVKVTDTEERKGRILAELDGLKDIRLESLLPVRPSPEMEHEIFRLDFADDGPTLLINEKLEDWKNVAGAPPFVSLVYPGVLRAILTRILCIEKEYLTIEDMEDWRSQWIRFVQGQPGIAEMIPGTGDENDGDVQDWIEEAVSAFCKHNQIHSSFVRYWQGQ